jgi:hypothetical protein
VCCNEKGIRFNIIIYFEIVHKFVDTAYQQINYTNIRTYKENQIIFTYSTINKFYIKINNYYYSSLLNNITKPYLNNIYIYVHYFY